MPLRDLPCLEEPLTGLGVSGLFNDSPYEERAFPLPGAEGVGVGVVLVRIRNVEDQGFAEQQEALFGAGVLAGGMELPNGFVHEAPNDGHPVGGRWLFPKGYPSPIGTRIGMRCTLECVVGYRLHPEVRLSYDFRLGHGDPPADPIAEPPHLELPDAPPDWIAIDRAVRAEVLSWTTEP